MKPVHSIVSKSFPAALRRIRLCRSFQSLASSQGATLVEVAVVVPLFVVVLLGIFEFSMALASYCSASYSAREGARYAGLHSPTSLSPAASSDIEGVVDSTLFLPGANESNTAVSYANYIGASSGNAVGNIVTVDLTWTQPISLPGYSQLLSCEIKASRVIVR